MGGVWQKSARRGVEKKSGRITGSCASRQSGPGGKTPIDRGARVRVSASSVRNVTWWARANERCRGRRAAMTTAQSRIPEALLLLLLN